MFDLNEPQQAAVAHRGGPLLIRAGAGSGKTGTLAHRVARLLSDGADPDRLCLVTFSRRAAQELLSTSDLAGSPLVDEDWLVLSTVHSAKGGEWEVVHLLHASDGMFPSDMATGDGEGIEEERRLLYVAVTRARSVLEVNVPLRYHHRRRPLTDAHSYAQAIRFLSPPVGALIE